MANIVVRAIPPCIAAVPCHNKSSGAETTPDDIVVYLYIHTSGMWISDNFREEAKKRFSPYNVEFVDLESEPLGGLFWPQDHEMKNDAEKMAKMAQSIVKNLFLFKNRLNVTAVYPSYKISNGLESNDLCVAVAVLGKGKIPVGEEIFPESMNLDGECYKIDIVEGYFIPAGLEEVPLCFGAGIGVRGARGAGTLGAFVTDGDDYFVLSCHHVLESAAEKQGSNEESSIINSLRRDLSDIANHIQKLEKDRRDLISENQRLETQGDSEEIGGSDTKPSGGMPSPRIVPDELMPDKIPNEKFADAKFTGRSPDEEKPSKGKSDAQKSLSDDERRDIFLIVESLKSEDNEIKNRQQQLDRNRDLIERKEEDLKELRDKMSKIKGHLELQELVDGMKKKLMEPEENGDRVQNEDKMRNQVRAPRRGEILIEQPSADDYVKQVIDLEKKKKEKEEECVDLEKKIEEIDTILEGLYLDRDSGRQSERENISKFENKKCVRKKLKETKKIEVQEHVAKLKRLEEDELPRCIATYKCPEDTLQCIGFRKNYRDSDLEIDFYVDAGIAKLFHNEREDIDDLKPPASKYDNMKYSNNVVPCSEMEKRARKNTFWKCGRTTGITKGAEFYSMINVKFTEDVERKLRPYPGYNGFGHVPFGPICTRCPKFTPHFDDSQDPAINPTNVCDKCKKDIPKDEMEDCWALNCFMLANSGEFAEKGDSGAIVFDEKNGDAWAMVVGTYRRGKHYFAVTSSLDITLKALNKRFGKNLKLCIKD